jgi:hypothetical protein
MTVPKHHWRSVACLHNEDHNNGDNGVDNNALASLAIPACLLDDKNSSSSSADDAALALLAVPYLLTQ